MKKRLFWLLTSVGGSSLGAFAVYAITHPAVMLLTMGTQARVSDRDSKCNVQLLGKRTARV